ncbi:PREDICTED: UBX domain-containing protein 2-like [Populus euphratica]|uniref:UBX domain-containing protein n=1 Tax=Populus euphratica TaxID=75702 RepID=A0AAJ6XJW8_POPEU|nr:PREDICTED: UBX domain-containing protein 2-like [Populus euphratica]
MLSENDEQSMVSSFLEIAVGQTAETARQFLQATSWKLEDAIQLFYLGNEGGAVESASHPLPAETWPEVLESGLKDLENEKVGHSDGDEVRAPLPVVRDTLYDDAMLYGASRTGYPPREASSLIAFRNFDEEMKHPGVWESDQGSTSTTDNSRDNLASLYRPPFHLMFHGSFEKAKGAASVQDKWLLVNLQSTKEFSSHMLNRDTWANEAVAQTISTNFIFWQVYDDTSEGRKVCTYYKLDSIPVVLIIDPITGQKMHSWVGMVQPENLLEDLVPFMDGGPRDHHKTLPHKRQRGSSPTPPKSKALVSAYETKEEDEEVLRALAASMESMKDSSVIASNKKDIASNDKDDASTAKGEEKCLTRTPTYPPLPEEPSGDKSLLCRVGIRLPDGLRVQRNFLKTDPIQLLWSFCYSLLEEAGTKLFFLKEAIPGAKRLDYDNTMTFGDSGLANSMISVAWE